MRKGRRKLIKLAKLVRTSPRTVRVSKHRVELYASKNRVKHCDMRDVLSHRRRR